MLCYYPVQVSSTSNQSFELIEYWYCSISLQNLSIQLKYFLNEIQGITLASNLLMKCALLGDISPTIMYYCNYPFVLHLCQVTATGDIANYKKSKKQILICNPPVCNFYAMQSRCHRWYWRTVYQNLRVVNNNIVWVS